MVAFAVEHQVGVNFVGDNEHIVGFAQSGKAQQRCVVPSDATGVVGVAQNHHFGLFLNKYFFEVVKVHLIAIVFGENERVVYHNAVVAFDHIFERVVNGRLNDDFIAGLCEIVDHKRDAFHHTWNVSDFVARHFEVVTVVEPIND